MYVLILPRRLFKLQNETFFQQGGFTHFLPLIIYTVTGYDKSVQVNVSCRDRNSGKQMRFCKSSKIFVTKCTKSCYVFGHRKPMTVDKWTWHLVMV